MEFLVPITLFISGFAMVFGIRYFINREKMAMIERGMNPKEGRSAPKPFLSLKFGLLLVGIGIGLLIALFTVLKTNLNEDNGAAVYFGCVSIFGGIGLIVSYVIEKKWLDQQPEDKKGI